MAKTSYGSQKIDKCRVVVCEGPHDRAFLEALHKRRNLPDAQILCAQDYGMPGGTGGFGKFLFDIIGWKGFEEVTDVIVVTDSDDNPNTSFASIRRQIEKIAADRELPDNYPIPQLPQTKTPGSPSITVLMVPWVDRTGALETLCFEAASRTKPEIAAYVDTFLSCCGGNPGLPPQKLDKVRLHSWIAAALPENPSKNLRDIWQEKSLIPIEDGAFDQIAEFFTNFA